MRRREILGLFAALAAVPAAARAAGEDEAKKKKGGGPSYIEIQSLAATINKPGGRRGVLTVECGLDVPDGDLRERAVSVLPRLRAAYAQTVQIYAAGLPPDTAPNADFLAQALQRQTDLTLGRRGARLLLGAILVN